MCLFDCLFDCLSVCLSVWPLHISSSYCSIHEIDLKKQYYHICQGVLKADNITAKFFAHVLIMETTGIFLCIGWFARNVFKFGKKSFLNQFVCNMFTLTFFLLRIIHFPISVYVVFFYTSSLGIAAYTLLPIIALQFVWFYKLVFGTMLVGDKDKSKGV